MYLSGRGGQSYAACAEGATLYGAGINQQKRCRRQFGAQHVAIQRASSGSVFDWLSTIHELFKWLVDDIRVLDWVVDHPEMNLGLLNRLSKYFADESAMAPDHSQIQN